MYFAVYFKFRLKPGGHFQRDLQLKKRFIYEEISRDIFEKFIPKLK